MTTQKIKNVIAVDSEEGAGAVTWWRLTNARHDALCADLLAHGVDEKALPVKITDAVALKRALDFRVKRGPQLDVIPLSKSGAYAVERRTVDGTDVRHATVFKVVLKEDGSLHVWEEAPGEEAAVRTLHAGYEEMRNVLDAYDIGMWLSTRVLPSLKAVSLREKGGVYYVPPTTIRGWQEVAAALLTHGSKIFEMPAMECDKAVDAILDAVTREAEEATRKMETELVELDLGATALRNRVSRLDAVLAKVASYEEMLGRKLPELHARFDALSANIAAAILTASAGDAGEEATA